MTIREQVAKTLDTPIGLGSWKSIFDKLAITNNISQKAVQDILAIVLTRLEELEVNSLPQK